MTLDLDRFQRQLEAEQTRLRHALAAVNHESSLLEETGDLAIGSGDHLADSATDTFMRELDEGLEENAEHLLQEIEAALGRIADGTYGTCSVAVESSTRPGSRQSRTPPSALTTSARRSASERTSPHGSDPRGRARGIDGERAAAHLERGALARRGIRPVARADRRGGRGDRRRPGDETGRRAHAGAGRQRRHRRAVLHPPRPELRHRLRPLREPDRAS